MNVESQLLLHAQYEELEKLIELDPEPESEAGKRLEYLADFLSAHERDMGYCDFVKDLK